MIKTEVVWEMEMDRQAMTENQTLIKTEVVWEMKMNRPAVTGNQTLIKKTGGGEGAARG